MVSVLYVPLLDCTQWPWINSSHLKPDWWWTFLLWQLVLTSFSHTSFLYPMHTSSLLTWLHLWFITWTMLLWYLIFLLNTPSLYCLSFLIVIFHSYSSLLFFYNYSTLLHSHTVTHLLLLILLLLMLSLSLLTLLSFGSVIVFSLLLSWYIYIGL